MCWHEKQVWNGKKTVHSECHDDTRVIKYECALDALNEREREEYLLCVCVCVRERVREMVIDGVGESDREREGMSERVL